MVHVHTHTHAQNVAISQHRCCCSTQIPGARFDIRPVYVLDINFNLFSLHVSVVDSQLGNLLMIKSII